jgi:hypothetical protein
MIELHERLSEFSYGYGVTRETEILLEETGIRAVPFLPSLIQEKKLGFDVKFDRPGTALMLQFKLGQSLSRFHNSSPVAPRPVLDRPFWRFAIDTAEPDGQFETLLKAENDGAEVYYAAPRFSDWSHYAGFFERRDVLNNSVLVRPSEIRAALDNQGATDGFHRIVYDRYRVHVCSEPRQIRGTDGDDAIAKVAMIARERQEPVGKLMERLLTGLDDRSSVRRDRPVDVAKAIAEPGIGERATGEYNRLQRNRRLASFQEIAKSREQAVAATVGVELWTLGIQLIVAVDEETKAV